MSLTIDELEQSLCEPTRGGWPTGCMKESAILRLNGGSSMIEYPRAELRQVLSELKQRIVVLESQVDTPTATDRFLLEVLMHMAGDPPKFKK